MKVASKAATSSHTVYDDESEDDDYQPELKKKKDKKKDTVTLEVPRNIFSSPQVTAMLDRSKSTSRVTTGVVASVLEAAGANLEDFTISKDTVHRQRNKMREEIANQVKAEFEDKNQSLHASTGTGS